MSKLVRNITHIVAIGAYLALRLSVAKNTTMGFLGMIALCIIELLGSLIYVKTNKELDEKTIKSEKFGRIVCVVIIVIMAGYLVVDFII